MLESRAVKERRSMFRDLVTLASIDGHLATEEMRLLAMLGKNMGLTQKDTDKVLKKPGGIKFEIPKDDNEKFKHVLRLVNMMVVDGRIDRREMDFCSAIAVKMGLQPSLVAGLVQRFVARLAMLAKAQSVRNRLDTRAGLDAEIEQFLRERR